MRQFLLGLYFLCFLNVASGQEIPLPENMPQEHPRVLTTPEGKRETWNLIKTEAWAEDVFNKLKERTEAYTRLTDVQPTWLLSDRKSTRLNSSHRLESRMPSSA